jgi:hypothetical protein
MKKENDVFERAKNVSYLENIYTPVKYAVPSLLYK